MRTLVIPTRQDVAHYRFRIRLSGQFFSFEFHWNEREQTWSFDLYRSTGELMTTGIRLVLGQDLLGWLASEHKPEGTLRLDDTSDEGREAGVGDLGTRVLLLYDDPTLEAI